MKARVKKEEKWKNMLWTAYYTFSKQKAYLMYKMFPHEHNWVTKVYWKILRNGWKMEIEFLGEQERPMNIQFQNLIV